MFLDRAEVLVCRSDAAASFTTLAAAFLVGLPRTARVRGSGALFQQSFPFGFL